MRTMHKIAALLLLTFGASAHAQELRIAAASDLQFAMNDLASRYEKRSGTKVAITYGSSGNLRAQIENGAPFDLFFSADLQYPQQLISKGLADPQSLYIYARGHLVLWARVDANLTLVERGFEALKDPRVTRIAIANPEHAPYGKAAVAAMQKVGVFDELKSKLVYGENISQAAQFVESGSAQVGILALSIAHGMKGGELLAVSPSFYPKLEQGAVLINASTNKAAARAFLKFVKTLEAQKVLSQNGFSTSDVPQFE